MSSIFSDGALHPGRDPNDAWWIVVRRPDDWGVDPRPDATAYDATRMVLELAPLPLAPGDEVAAIAIGPDGTRYTLDAIGGRVLVQPPCDVAPTPLRGVGGVGREVGRLGRPVAIAVDERGWLYVVEADNHRVSVIDPGDPRGARVVITLGAVDGWGRPIAGDVPGALRDPVAVAVGRGRIYVGQRAGWVQAYDRQFRVGPRFEARRPGAPAGELLGLAAIDGGLVVIAVGGWSQLVHFTCDGEFDADVAWDDAPPALAALGARARYELEGTRIVGPIDGGRDGLAWHQIVVDAVLPPGSSIEVQTWAADAIAGAPPTLSTPPTLPELRVPREVTPWAPDAPVGLPADGEARRGELTRLVHADVATWTRWRGGPYRRGGNPASPSTLGPRWSLDGTGPLNSAGFTTTLASARRLRVGDQVELTRPGLPLVPTILTTISTVADSALAVFATGPRMNYAAGTRVVLRERGGRALDEPWLATLRVGESFDLTGILLDGGGGDVAVPHRIAALLRRGDLIELSNGGPPTLVKLDGIDPAPVAIALATVAAGDYRDATLRLVATVDERLVCETAEGWGDGFPPSSTIEVTSASATLPTTLRVVWSEPDTATVWAWRPPEPVPPTDWTTLAVEREPSATDRGRYLWIKLHLRGARRHAADAAAIATPTVRALRAVAPRLSYLSYLPAVFGRRDADTPVGSTFLERFLAMFESRLTRVEERFELVARWLNPRAADDEWLAFVASWFALILDASWPRARRAALLAQIVELYRLRGTRAGLERTVELYTGHRPQLLEGFQVRPRAGLILGCAGVLGCAPLGGLDRDAAAGETLLAAYAHRLEVVAFVDHDCDLDVATTALTALLDAIKPAHVDVALRVTTRSSRIGLASMIGLDFVLGDDPTPPAPLGGTGARGQLAPILGVDATLLGGGGGAALGDGSTASIGELTLR